jgi:zinc D-Ala-D-Ala carboxypeptidase
MIIQADQKLTDNFSLFEMTKTSMVNFQEMNRDLDEVQISKLTEVARLGEWVRNFLTVPLIIHSGYRCKPLNDAVGSSDRSQHLLCEAMDFVSMGQDIGNAFRMLWGQVFAGNLKVGQLIFETAQRKYGVEQWIHISLGIPYRDSSKCNQVLRMIDGTYTFFNGGKV